MRRRYDIKISGNGDLAGFLTNLATSSTKILSLSVGEGVARFRTDRQGLMIIRRTRRRYHVTVKVSLVGEASGAKGVFNSNFFVIACVIPFIASLFLWTVEVESEWPEVEERIYQKLEKASIVPLRLLAFIPDEGEIRRELMLDDPSLSWVRFRRDGATLTVIPMLSPQTTDEIVTEEQPSDLVARTGGVITGFALKKGERVSRVHQTVQKGDTLATGVLVQGDKRVIVGADGAVYADYWMEYSFSLPSVVEYRLQGEETVEFSFNFPWQPQKKKWSLKSFIQTERHINDRAGQFELVAGMEETVLIPLLKNKLLSESLTKAVIQDDKVLHVSFDNDKVSGTILFLINDNIAVKRPISQGE
ncbi:sporulation protein YqfD [Sporosarcina beigongshangi]|uniref:sporulation protein YqfD n=1 Tax=Sporosarcina beigongshangi TaxID=2782538 RepID=UPI00193ACFBD|nr:sporulation protein YqfD [Sporosarcina beigongshangi]